MGDPTAPLQGFPRGWFLVAFSDELQVGDVKPARYFGCDLVLYRDLEGRARVADAHCPHRGAHLGHGGKVTPHGLRCPFHGHCIADRDVAPCGPKDARLLPSVALRQWPIEEHSGMIFLFYARSGPPPEYRVPPLPVGQGSGWTAWNHSRLRIRTHSREIVENVVDIAHFRPVHQTNILRFENRFEGHLAVQDSAGTGIDEYADSHYSIRATYHGPGVQFSEMSHVMDSLLVNAHTMVEEDVLDLRFAMCARETSQSWQTERFVEAYVGALRTGFEQDVAIWEHKVYRPTPTLCDGDGPLAELRRWYRQFFTPVTVSQPDSA